MSPSAPASQGRPARVTAVVVAHDGQAWIPRLAESLEASSRLPDQLVAVDTMSSDDSAGLLADVLGPDAVVRAFARTSFGAAVQTGIDHADMRSTEHAADGAEQWVWILHDDMAVQPDALQHLLAAVEADADVDIVGPKVREWPTRKRLLEVGLTATGTGRRDGSVERGEYDQGQHDRSRDVLAIGSAGMLVRRSVWDHLGGFDPHLPFFSDDLDFGWRAARAGYRARVCPDAVVYHAAAASRGRRTVDAVRGRTHRLQRAHTLLTVLANCRGWAVPLVAVRLLLGCTLRALGLLLIRAPRQALDEMLAISGVLLRPGRLLSMRRRRRAISTADPAEVRPLLAPWWAPYRRGVDSVGQVVAEVVDAVAARRHPAAAAEAEPGPVAEESENLDADTGPVGWLVRHPMGAVVAVLVLLSLVAPAVDLFGRGVLSGGALLPAPPAVSDWWSLYVESWHPVAAGSETPAPPYVVLLAALGTLLLGQEWLVVDVLVGGAVPLSALTAYAVSGRLVGSRAIRIWAAVTYGLLPVLTGAVAQGRIGTIASTVLAPLMLWSMVRTVAAQRRPDQRLRSGIASGLVLAAVAAFTPSAWVLAVLVVAGLGAVRVVRTGVEMRSLAGLLAVVVLPVVVLLPWSLHLGLDPVRWLTDAGYAAGPPRLAQPPGWELGLARPGGPGDAPPWLSAGLVAAAVAALFRVDRRASVLTAWAVGIAALAVVVLQRSEGVWPGFTLVVVHGAAVVAAAVAADGAVDRLAGASFGWKQPVAVLVTAAAVLATVGGVGWWVSAEDSLLVRSDQRPIPAYMADAQLESTGGRTLVLSPDGSGVDVHLSRGPGMYIGQDAVQRDGATVTEVAGRLVTDPGPDDIADVAALGVTFVVLRQPDPAMIAAIDSAPGVQRASAGDVGAAAWRLDVPTGGARLADGTGLADAEVLASDAGELDTDIREAGNGRRLLLAERADDGWSASLDGTSLEAAEPTRVGTQVFDVPAAAGRLAVDHSNGRGWWLGLQAGVLVLALVLAAPVRRRDEAEVDER